MDGSVPSLSHLKDYERTSLSFESCTSEKLFSSEIQFNFEGTKN